MSRASSHRRLSLKWQLAITITVLAFLPNVILATTVFVPFLDRLSEVSQRIWFLVSGWLFLILLISGLLGYFLSRQLLNPLVNLNEQLTALPKRNETITHASLIPHVNDPPEVLALKKAFNNLLRDIEIEQSRRRSFIATLMHDLKTPLVAGNNLLEVVKDSETIDSQERSIILEQLLAENKRLLELVQKMVDAHKFERDDVPLKRKQEDMKGLVERVILNVQPLAKAQGVEIRLRGETKANVDAREVERALYNLISNAVRYAKEAISIELFPNLIRLSDDGPGLPAPLESLAQPFNNQPVTIAGKEYAAGTGGLGLFIARRILEAHGGRLVVESTGQGGTILLAYLGR